MVVQKPGPRSHSLIRLRRLLRPPRPGRRHPASVRPEIPARAGVESQRDVARGEDIFCGGAHVGADHDAPVRRPSARHRRPSRRAGSPRWPPESGRCRSMLRCRGYCAAVDRCHRHADHVADPGLVQQSAQSGAGVIAESLGLWRGIGRDQGGAHPTHRQRGGGLAPDEPGPDHHRRVGLAARSPQPRGVRQRAQLQRHLPPWYRQWLRPAAAGEHQRAVPQYPCPPPRRLGRGSIRSTGPSAAPRWRGRRTSRDRAA